MGCARYTVIVAEDEELLLNNLIQKIQSTDLNFEVVGKAQTGAQALDLVEELSPDLIISDIRMPVIDGITFLETVYNKYPYIKTIIISGFSDFEYAKRAIKIQVSEYLLKPIDPKELYNALLNIKNKIELERSAYSDIFDESLSRSTPEQIAKALKDHITCNYNQDININLIANSMNFCASYLTKIFSQQFEITPSKYIISLRVSKAKNLLSHNQELSIKQIGELIGYYDQGYFSRIFKKYTGMSPFEFRENVAGSIGNFSDSDK